MLAAATRVRRYSMLVLALGLACAIGPARPAHAAAGNVIVDWHYSTSAVSVSGVASVPVVITVHATGGPGSIDGFTASSVSSDGKKGLFVAIRRVSGTAADGVYEGTYQVTAGQAGVFTLRDVWSETGAGATETAPVPTGATLTVRATHLPRLSIGTSPSQVALTTPFSIKGRLWDSSTGRGLPGVSVTLSTICGAYCPLTSTRTNALGYYAFPYRTRYGILPFDPHRMFIRTEVLGARQSDGWRNWAATASMPYVPILTTVPAQPSKHWRPVGARLTVTGRVRGWPFFYDSRSIADYLLPRCQVVLERRTSTSSWARAAVAWVSSDARFTLSTRATSRGSYRYRVLLPGCYSVVRTRSSVFHVVVG